MINVADEGAHYKMNKNSTCGVKLEYLHLAKEVHNQEATFQSPQDKGILQFKSNVTNKLDEVGLYFSSGTKRKISGPGQLTEFCKVYVLRCSFIVRFLLAFIMTNFEWLFMNH